MQATAEIAQAKFFEYLYAEDEGFVCVSSRVGLKNSTFEDTFFKWPHDATRMLYFIKQRTITHNLWYCPHLLSEPRRLKQNAQPVSFLWADLDTCSPDRCVIEPQVIVESSVERYQALWKLDQKLDPYEAEALNKRIAYAYQDKGADSSGWDLTQLLRIPFTYNYKYDVPPVVTLLQAHEDAYSPDKFDFYPAVKGEIDPNIEVPALDDLPIAEELLHKYAPNLRKTQFTELYAVEPDEEMDWSGRLWRLIMICFEADMSREEVFAIAIRAACNKYARDKRPSSHLWKDVIRAEASHQQIQTVLGNKTPKLEMPVLTTPQERAALPETVLTRYRAWATQATDAPPDYHDLCAMIVLSTICASGLVLNTSYGPMYPNLWGLILGESTLARKTTAMRLAKGFIEDIDREYVVASDGSAEGLLSRMAERPNRTSMYFKDEIAGLFESFRKKDYLAGIPEVLTEMYDVPSYYPRVLRKETITLIRPYFIFFGGGIRHSTYSLISDNMILSGFMPRFLVVCGETSVDNVRATGPVTILGSQTRQDILEEFSRIKYTYDKTVELEIAGAANAQVQQQTEVILTPRAWERYQAIEKELLALGNACEISDKALPTLERLSRSTLKMSMLIAASRVMPTAEGHLEVTETDVIIAASYAEKWGPYMIDLVQNSGKTSSQHIMDQVMRTINKYPGIARSDLMNTHRLHKREMDEIQGTLVDRDLIVITQSGRATIYNAR